MRTLYFITSNKGKFLEAKEKLRPLGFSVIQKDLGYPEIQAESLEDVALQGITHVRMSFKKPFILEDAGLFIEALHGFPGVFSKWQTIAQAGGLRSHGETGWPDRPGNGQKPGFRPWSLPAGLGINTPVVSSPERKSRRAYRNHPFFK